MKKFALLFLAAVFMLPSLSYAEKWQTVGTRAMGMGGAGVALATGSDGQYYNPATLANKDAVKTEFSLNVNGEMETTKKVLELVDKITKLADKYNDVSAAIDSGNKIDAEHVNAVMEGLSALSQLNTGNIGASINANAGLGAKIGKFAVSVRSYAGVGVTPVIDTKNIGIGAGFGTTGIVLGENTSPAEPQAAAAAAKIADIITANGLVDGLNSILGTAGYNATQISNAIVNMAVDAGSDVKQIEDMADVIAKEIPKAADIINNVAGGSYTKNETQVLFDAGNFTEVSFGYGHEVYKGVQVGGNLKIINGQMAQMGIMAMSNKKDVSDLVSDTMKNTKNTLNAGIDLGVLVDISKLLDKKIPVSPKFGLTARNINSPSFDRPDKPADAAAELIWNTSDYTLDRQVRAGVSVNPLNRLAIGLDVDVVSNKTFASDYKSQEFALGAEYLLFSSKAFTMPLRIGFNKNIADSDSGSEYTIGFGLDFACFKFELAGGICPETTKVDGNDIPQSAAVAFNFGIVF